MNLAAAKRRSLSGPAKSAHAEILLGDFIMNHDVKTTPNRVVARRDATRGGTVRNIANITSLTTHDNSYRNKGGRLRELGRPLHQCYLCYFQLNSRSRDTHSRNARVCKSEFLRKLQFINGYCPKNRIFL